MGMMLMRKLTAILAACFLPAVTFGQVAAARGPKTAEAAVKPAESTSVVGIKYTNSNHMDPFLNPVLLKKESAQKNRFEEEEVSRGSAPPGIAGMFLNQVQLLGISTSAEKRTAVFRGSDKRAYFLQEGDKVFDGFVKKIGTDDVLMIRETQYKSGKTVTQEVTKRLRTP
jgi:hypothetical protein